jgi:hypothetical protein
VTGEAAMKQKRPTFAIRQIVGFDDGSGLLPLSAGDTSIPPCGHNVRRSKVMAEAVISLCVFFSIGVFLAHAIDAFRATR